MTIPSLSGYTQSWSPRPSLCLCRNERLARLLGCTRLLHLVEETCEEQRGTDILASSLLAGFCDKMQCSILVERLRDVWGQDGKNETNQGPFKKTWFGNGATSSPCLFGLMLWLSMESNRCFSFCRLFQSAFKHDWRQMLCMIVAFRVENRTLNKCKVDGGIQG